MRTGKQAMAAEIGDRANARASNEVVLVPSNCNYRPSYLAQVCSSLEAAAWVDGEIKLARNKLSATKLKQFN